MNRYPTWTDATQAEHGQSRLHPENKYLVLPKGKYPWQVMEGEVK